VFSLVQIVAAPDSPSEEYQNVWRRTRRWTGRIRRRLCCAVNGWRWPTFENALDALARHHLFLSSTVHEEQTCSTFLSFTLSSGPAPTCNQLVTRAYSIKMRATTAFVLALNAVPAVLAHAGIAKIPIR
jgi:hypothetical protein